jgi:hypothetical protein
MATVGEKQQDLYTQELVSMGWIEEKQTRKYRVMVLSGKKNKYFLGNRGGVRFGPTQTDSISLTDRSDPLQYARDYERMANAMGEMARGIVASVR